MRVKTAPRLCPQPARLSCHVSASVEPEPLAVSHVAVSRTVGSSQHGAGKLLLLLFIVAIAATAVVASVFGHMIGYQSGYHELESEAVQAASISKQASNEVKDLRLSNKVMENQVKTAKQELAISLANLDDIQKRNQVLKTENRQVEQLNTLYGEFIAEQGGMPLQVLGYKITPLPENAFEYGFDVAMLSEDGQAKNLTVTLTLLDKDNFISVPLDPANYAIEGIVRIRGRFVMPEDFEPLQVKLSLEAGDEEVEQLYDWELGDMVDNMPLSLTDLPEVDESPITPEAN